MKKDPFLNFTPAYMKADLDDCCAQDLDLPSRYEEKLSMYNVFENFSTFFRFMGPPEEIVIQDITIEDGDYAICGFHEYDGYHVCGFAFNISIQGFKQNECWDLINIACMIYLGLEIPKEAFKGITFHQNSSSSK